MDPLSEMTNRKRKKYTKRSFLTVDKKSKRYRINRSCQSGTGPSITDQSSTSDATSENKSLTTHDKSNTSRDKSNTCNANNTPTGYCEQHQKYQHPKMKGIQVKPFIKAVGVQASCVMKMHGVQTLQNKSIRSSRVQTETVKKKKSNSQILLHGELLRNRLFSQSKFEVFAQKLHDYEQTEKSIKCIYALSSGILPFYKHGMEKFFRHGDFIIVHLYN